MKDFDVETQLTEEDLFYMDEALKRAEIAYENNEIPIGCVIVHEGRIIGRGENRRKLLGNVLMHAEIIAIDEACKYMRDWRLEDCTCYVTIEPCPMCAGAILQARIPRLVFGAHNPKAGCVGSLYNLLDDKRFNHTVDVTSGVKVEKCSELMTRFFKEFREREKALSSQVDSDKGNVDIERDNI